MRPWPLLAACIVAVPLGLQADEQVRSGPQVGEKLAPLTIQGVFGEALDTKVELAPDEHRGPIVLVFVHKSSRPSLAVARLTAQFAATRVEAKIQAATVFLAEDVMATEKWMQSAESSLPDQGAIGISVDGATGPEAYQLDPDVALTILVANDQRVTANIPLVDPDVERDVPRILQAIADVTGGGEIPSIESLVTQSASDEDKKSNVRALLAPLLAKDASAEQVQQAAEQIEQAMAESERLQRRIGQTCRNIVRSGKLSSYASPAAQVFIRAWAEKYAPPEQVEDDPQPTPPAVKRR